jgi:hypothetical protein
MDTGEASVEEDSLVVEFNEWLSGEKKIISLDQVVRNVEGKARLQLKIDSKQSFTLHCPINYPDYQDDNFFVEAPCSLQLCNALKEFLLDSSYQLSLGTILSKDRRESEMEDGTGDSKDEGKEIQEDEQQGDLHSG